MAARNDHEAGPGAATAQDRPDGLAPLAPVTARGEATRRRILDAAESVFGERGYYEASVSEITRRAGVAQGTFYIYFHTKREAFIELIGDIGERLREASSIAIRGASHRLSAERNGFEAFLQFVAAHRHIYRLVEEAGRVAPEAARDYYHRIASGYERGLSTAMQTGQIREGNVEGLAYALMGIAHFMALRWLVWPPADDGSQSAVSEEQPQTWTSAVPPVVFESVMDFIANGLLPPEPGARSLK